MRPTQKDSPSAFLSRNKPVSEFAADVRELRQMLAYDLDTGVFTWLAPPSRSGLRLVGRQAGCVTIRPGHGYRTISIHSLQFRAHLLAWIYVYGVRPTAELDHINGCRADNRLANLRDVSRTVNRQNQRIPGAGNSTGFLGVSRDCRRQRFRARLKVDGRLRSFGSFDTPEEAHAAYLTAKRRLHEGCTL